MDYNALLDMTTELGYRLAMNGAETFRIEESVIRVMQAYGIHAEAFAIPNCLHVSIVTADGLPMTRMRRIGYHENDLDAVEKYSNLSRKICQECPPPSVGVEWLNETTSALRRYPTVVSLSGHFLGAFGFAVLFGGHWVDCLFSGFCGIVIGLINLFMHHLKANQFFRLIAASFVMALFSYSGSALGILFNSDAVIIGALMILVPGLLFTNAMRDIIYGDTNSGINRIVQVFLIAIAIALGTAASWKLADQIWFLPVISEPVHHHLLIEVLACLICCTGFSIQFNIQGPGLILCALGGCVCWVTYKAALHFHTDSLTAYLLATLIAAFYAETMARIRKYPAISYQVISVLPLIPGAGAYYAMNCAVKGDMDGFTNHGTQTVAIAGTMAIGILLAATIMRIIFERIQKRNH